MDWLKDTIVLVTVVPMFAPIITGIAWRTDITKKDNRVIIFILHRRILVDINLTFKPSLQLPVLVAQCNHVRKIIAKCLYKGRNAAEIEQVLNFLS